MSRPYRSTSIEVIRERIASKQARLAMLIANAADLANELEQREIRFKSVLLDSSIDDLGARDYGAFVAASIQDRKEILAEELQHLLDEIEEREIEQEESRDPTGGIAA